MFLSSYRNTQVWENTRNATTSTARASSVFPMSACICFKLFYKIIYFFKNIQNETCEMLRILHE